MRLFVAALVLALLAPAPAQSSEPCVRALQPSDVSVQIVGDELSIVTANLQGSCDIILVQRPPGGPRNDVAVGIYALSASLQQADDGRSLEWFARSGQGQDSKKRVERRLKPGSAIVQRTNMLTVVRQLEQEAKLKRKSALPWGSTVLIRIVHIAESKAELEPGGPVVRGLQQEILPIEFPRLAYRLPPDPPK
jgi:hypothetical protein